MSEERTCAPVRWKPHRRCWSRSIRGSKYSTIYGRSRMVCERRRSSPVRRSLRSTSLGSTQTSQRHKRTTGGFNEPVFIASSHSWACERSWSDLHSQLEEKVLTTGLARAKVDLLFPVRSGVPPRSDLLFFSIRRRQEVMRGDPLDIGWLESRTPVTDEEREDFVKTCSEELQGGVLQHVRTRLRPRARGGSRLDEFSNRLASVA
jgi:hypothetical protein